MTREEIIEAIKALPEPDRSGLAGDIAQSFLIQARESDSLGIVVGALMGVDGCMVVMFPDDGMPEMQGGQVMNCAPRVDRMMNATKQLFQAGMPAIIAGADAPAPKPAEPAGDN